MYNVNNLFLLSPVVEMHWEIKWSHFDLKVESRVELKFDPGLENIWVIGEYLRQIDSVLRVNSNWLSIPSMSIEPLLFKLTFNTEYEYRASIIQIDSQYRVNLTQIFSNYSESGSAPWLNFLGQNDSIFSFSAFPPIFSFSAWIIYIMHRLQ